MGQKYKGDDSSFPDSKNLLDFKLIWLVSITILIDYLTIKSEVDCKICDLKI